MSVYNKMTKNEVPPGFESELDNIAVDFDGVLHTFDKGFFDGTCYGKPIKNSLNAIKRLSKSYKVIIFTAKARPDRPLVNGKTGLDLVQDWLSKHGFSQYITEVTWEKPRAKYYIDDKAIRFLNWDDTLSFIYNG